MDKKQISTWIQGVRKGDAEAFECLFRQYRPLIDASVTRFCKEDLPDLQRDDLRQEAILVFYQSILTYDLEQTEVEFGLYAKICIYHGLISQLRVQKRHVAEPLPDSLEALLSDREAEDPSEQILEKEREAALYSTIRGTLSALEYRVWQLYLSGRTAREIGALLGKEEKAIHNAIYRIRKKLRQALR